ncbi:MAG TPA: hypothetical protein VK988_09135, partial [Acidimicrobiales bacterium]|nr:hypothetical protein [Acidimicrobiales bacterium]
MPNPAHPEGVPLDVWLFNHDTATSPPSVRRQLATRLIEVYSPPGGVVVDLAPACGEVLAAATEAGRSTIVASTASVCESRRRPAVLDSVQGSADLVVVLPPAGRLAPPRAHNLSATALSVVCRRAAPLLRPGGFLVIGVVGGAPATHLDPLAAAVNGVASEGLAYFQHVVAVIPSCLGAAGRSPADRPFLEVTRMTPQASAESSAAGDGSRRLAHVDLVVLGR